MKFMQIYFYYPSSIVGGCELLMIRLCKIATNSGIKAQILCGHDEIYRQKDFRNGVNLATEIDFSYDATVPIIITPISEINHIFTSKNTMRECRFIFAITHPQLLTKRIPYISNALEKLGINPNITHRYLLPFDFWTIKRLLKLTNQNNSAFYVIPQFKQHYEKVFAVDLENWKYLPLPIQSQNVEKQRTTNKSIGNFLRLTYIGRIEDAQTELIKYLLNEVSKLSSEFTITLQIVGDGKSLSDIKLMSKLINKQNISVVFLGRLNPDNLANILVNSTDIAFGTGTSALEAAYRGIPTCLLDASFHTILDYRFRWIHNPSDFPLGCLLEDYPEFSGGKFTLSELLTDFIVNSNILSDSAKIWATKNHSDSRILSGLEEILSEDGIKYQDLIRMGLKNMHLKHLLLKRIKMGVLKLVGYCNTKVI